MKRYWPDYLRSMGLWGKPKSEWPLSVQKELMCDITPAWVLKECAWALENNDDEEEFMSAVEFMMESLNY
jgi:hypothetical protein